MRRGVTMLTVLLVLAGCGTSTPAVQVEDLQALLTAAPEAARSYGTAAMTMRMDVTSPDQDGTATFQARGVIGFDPVRFALTGAMSGPGMSGTYEMRLVDNAMYMRMPQFAAILPEGIAWIAVDLDALAEQSGVDVSALMSSGQTQDPTAMLQMLRGTSSQVEVVGQEVVRGVSTTRYRATIETALALQQVPDDVLDQVSAAVAQLPDRYVMEVWLDDQGLTRRTAYELTLEPQAGAPVTQSVTMEMFDYGAQVEVVAPPAETTQDLFELGSS